MLRVPIQNCPPQCSSMHHLKPRFRAEHQVTAQPSRRGTIRWLASWVPSQSERSSRHPPQLHRQQRALQRSLRLCTGPSQRYLPTLSLLYQVHWTICIFTVVLTTMACLAQFAQRRQRSQQPQQGTPPTGPSPSGRAQRNNGADEHAVPQARDATSSEAPSERARIDAENRARLAQMDPAEVDHGRPL